MNYESRVERELTTAPEIELTPKALIDAVSIVGAVELVQDRSFPIEDRGAAYALLHQVQLRINRALRTAKDDLIVHLESNGLREMGPLSIKATPFDVKWPANDPANFEDAGVQETLELFARFAPEWVVHVPSHWEVRTAELGAAVHAGDPVARQLHRELKERGLRTEEGRRLSIAVREAPVVKGEAA